MITVTELNNCLGHDDCDESVITRDQIGKPALHVAIETGMWDSGELSLVELFIFNYRLV